MKSKNILLSFLLISSVSLSSQASDLHFTLGTGYPFTLIAEGSMATEEGDKRWYSNFKEGLGAKGEGNRI